MINRKMVSEQDKAEIQKLIADIKKLCSSKVELKAESFPAISLRDYKDLHTIVTNLAEIGKLSDETFAQALKLVSEKIPTVEASTLQKQNSKNGRSSRTLDGSFTYYQKIGAKKNSDFHGGQANINKAYLQPGDVDPAFAVKRFQGNKSLQDAAREAKYTKLYNRNIHMFSNRGGGVIVSDFFKGGQLEDTDGNHSYDFSKYSYTRRFTWLLSALNDLEVLHKRHHLHGDVKPQNLILNVDSDEMRLMDFGGAHKVNSKSDEYSATMSYVEMKDGRPQKPQMLASDMYAIGYVTATLFPELFELNDTIMMVKKIIGNGIVFMIPYGVGPCQVDKIKTNNLTALDKSVINFVDALMDANAENRCTNLQAIEFCKQMIAVKDGELNEAKLQEILSKTLNRKEFEVEDALRNSKRPAMFANGEKPAEDERKKAGDKSPKSTAALFNPAQEMRAKTEDEGKGIEIKWF